VIPGHGVPAARDDDPRIEWGPGEWLAEVERLSAQSRGWRASSEAQYERAEKARADVERLRLAIALVCDAAVLHGVNDRVASALAYAELVSRQTVPRETSPERKDHDGEGHG
jgi:hypothetical protein